MTTNTVEMTAPDTDVLLKAVEVTTVPFGLLVDSDLNVRNNAHLKNIPELADNIKIVGRVCQNLIVYIVPGKKKADQKYAVAAGRRRKAALTLLRDKGNINDQFPVPVQIVAKEIALLISTSENGMRENMHPFHEIQAYTRLIEEGRSIAFIASVFGVTPLTVQRRLKLASMSPKLLDLLLNDEITLEQLSALALTDDHETQERVWANAEYEYMREPSNLRSSITLQEIKFSRSSMAKFVTLATYEAAGGKVRRDLFGEEEDSYILDPELLQKLAGEKLQAQADEQVTQGWKWAEILPSNFDYSARAKYAAVDTKLRDFTEEESTQYKALLEKRDELSGQFEALCNDECDEENEAWQILDKQYDQVTAEIQALDDARKEAVDKSQAGVVVYLSDKGEVQFATDLVRPEDVAEAISSGAPIKDHNGVIVQTAEPKVKPIHSEKLVRQLSAHKTVAVQAELIAQPNIAIVALTYQFLRRTFSKFYCGRDVLTIHADSTESELKSNAEDICDSKAWKAREAAHAAWEDKLPEGFEKSMNWLLAWPQEEVLNLLGYLIAIGVNGIQTQESETYVLDPLAQAVKLDMSQYWQATSSGYFNKVNRQRIHDVVAEAVSYQQASTLDAMKKAEAAEAAEKLVAGTGWLPPILCTSLLADDIPY